MRYIHDTREIRQDVPSIVTIGKFDGFHEGHKKLIRQAHSLKQGAEQVVLFTFSQSPQGFLAGTSGTELLEHDEKIHMAEKLGVDVLIEYPFTDEVRHMSAMDFLKDILCEQLRAVKIVAGPDCSFGYGRQGNIDFLQEHRMSLGYEVHVVEKQIYRLQPISSSRIRESLSKGKIPETNDMLGYRFGYCGIVTHGNQIGRTLGFPTINLWIPEGKIVPEYGVYASLAVIDGMYYPAVSNIGRKPTIPGEKRPNIETYIYDFQKNVYDQPVSVELLQFFRPENKFSSLEALKKRVNRDKEEVRTFFEAQGYLLN